MTSRFVHSGDSCDYIPADADVSAGDLVAVGDGFAVARLDIPKGTLGTLHFDGIEDLEKGEGVAVTFPFGSVVYWNPTTKKAANAESAGFRRLGVCVSLSDTADAPVVRYRLNG